MSEPVWGSTMCSIRNCVALAECIYQDEPMCIDCADFLIERQAAISLYPAMREKLPDMSDR